MALFGSSAPESDEKAVVDLVPADQSAAAPVVEEAPKPAKAKAVDEEDAPFDPNAGTGAFIDIPEEG